MKAEETADVEQHVWVQPGDESASGPAAWLAGGTYLAVRRIRMVIETWDRSALREQEQIIGRTKAEGAPLSGGTEFTEPDFARDRRRRRAAHRGRLARAAGPPVPPRRGADAAPRLQLHGRQRHARAARRRAVLRRLRARPRTGFIPIQDALARTDALREYLVHTGSGLYAVPPGVASIGADGTLVGDDYLGAGLFA